MPRPIIYPEDAAIALVQLTQGKFAVIDRADAELIGQFNWCAIYAANTQSFYAVRRDCKSGRMIAMQNAIMPLPVGFLVDHADLDTLNNRRGNLRQATFSQNMQNKRLYRNNKSGCKGVAFRPSHRMWVSRISVDGKRKHLGYFADMESAIAARREAEKIHYGEFARHA